MTEQQKWRYTDAATAVTILLVFFLFIFYKMDKYFPNTKADRIELTILDKDTLVSTESFLCGRDVAKWVCQLKSVYLTNPDKINTKTDSWGSGTLTYGTLWLIIYEENRVGDMNHQLSITESDSKVLYEIWNDLKNKRSREEVNLENYE